MAVIETRRRKDGSTSYRVRISLKGHPRISQTFRRKTDAKQWAQSTEAAIRERRYKPGAEAERRTVGELRDRFAAEWLPLRRESHRQRYQRQIDWWVDQLGADSKLAILTPARIVEARNQLSAGKTISGRPAGPATVNRFLAILSKALSMAAKEWFWIDDNPCRLVPRPREPRGRVRFLTEDERLRLLAACEASEERRLYPLVLLALATGARQGEMMTLCWRDVDLTRGTMVLHETKNHERRSVPVTGTALEVLRERSKVRRIDTDLVFANRYGKAPFPRQAWDRALREAGFEDFRFHDLRHTAASYLAMSGATVAEIAEVLGHKTLAMVMRYAHLTEGHTRGVLERMTSQYL
ncbi:MAG: site-specific integrase [bacterium]|nr:site-specific integrase [bacterium]